MKEIEKDYGIESDEYKFALADEDVSGTLTNEELRTAGLKPEDAARLQKAWKNKKPPTEKTPVQKKATGSSTAGIDGQATRSPHSSYDDAILRQARANSTYSSDTVNNSTTAKIAQGADQSVDTIGNVSSDYGANWVPPSQRGIS